MDKNPLYNEKDKTRSYVANDYSIDPFRSEFRRDYARLLHSPSFRRLQGKTQLFPSHESDFSRNRLTHSLEVAQIAKSIAKKINHLPDVVSKMVLIDEDIVEFAGLAHDLGHPPFGHNGELALDEKMRDGFGGFEGNAQTLRILTRIEKKETLTRNDIGEPEPTKDGKDNRCGLNLTARSLASILKYDQVIPEKAENRPKEYISKACKGYYLSEQLLVDEIKKNVLDLNSIPKEIGKFKTIECQIMDVADDIAYSTYDLEDAFKANFLDPIKMLAISENFKTKLAKDISRSIAQRYPDEKAEFTAGDVVTVLLQIFERIFSPDMSSTTIPEFQIAARLNRGASMLSQNSYFRTSITSSLVANFIGGVQFHYNDSFPPLSEVKLDINTFKQVEVLKKFTYFSIIESPMLQIAEYKGKQIVGEIFDALSANEDGYKLLPMDYRMLYEDLSKIEEKRRLICDFIAGMTDKYCIDFYNKLFGTSKESIHIPF